MSHAAAAKTTTHVSVSIAALCEPRYGFFCTEHSKNAEDLRRAEDDAGVRSHHVMSGTRKMIPMPRFHQQQLQRHPIPTSTWLLEASISISNVAIVRL